MSTKFSFEIDNNDFIENKKENNKTLNAIIEGFHFMICIMFFTITLVLTLKLTLSLVNMQVPEDDEHAITAKQLMTSAVVISYLFDFLIIFTVLGFIVYTSYHPEDYMNESDKIKQKTGAKNIYVGFRVIIFSLLMLLSIIMSSLCFAASLEIEDSNDPGKYTDQYNSCKELGQTFMLHFIIFTFAQGAIYLFKGFSTSGIIPPESIESITSFAK